MGPYRDAMHREQDPDADAAKEALASHLHRDETLLWAGRPPHGLFARGTGVRPANVGWVLLVAGVVGFQFWFDRDVGALRALLSAVFLTVAASVLFGPFVRDARERARTFYGLTPRRVLVVVARGMGALTQFDLRRTAFALEPRRDGTGTITMEVAVSATERAARNRFDYDRALREQQSGGDALPSSDGGGGAPPRLRAIANAEEVFRRIEEAKGRLSPF